MQNFTQGPDIHGIILILILKHFSSIFTFKNVRVIFLENKKQKKFSKSSGLTSFYDVYIGVILTPVFKWALSVNFNTWPNTCQVIIGQSLCTVHPTIIPSKWFLKSPPQSFTQV